VKYERSRKICTKGLLWGDNNIAYEEVIYGVLKMCTYKGLSDFSHMCSWNGIVKPEQLDKQIQC